MGGNKKGKGEKSQKGPDKDVAVEPRKSNKVKVGQKESFDNSQYKLLNDQLHILGLKLRTIQSDGNCAFRAIADQLEGNQGNHMKFRQGAVEEIKQHAEEFLPFIGDQNLFVKHCNDMSKGGTWGTHLELVAIANKYHCNLVIHQLNTPRFFIKSKEYRELEELQHFNAISFSSSSSSSSSYSSAMHDYPTLHLAYHDQEHYSSIRMIEDNKPNDIPMRIYIHETKEGGGAQHEGSSKKSSSSSSSSGVDTSTLSLPERIVWQSTHCRNIKKIRRLLKECDNDIDGVTEILIDEEAAGMDVNGDLEDFEKDKGGAAKVGEGDSSTLSSSNGKPAEPPLEEKKQEMPPHHHKESSSHGTGISHDEHAAAQLSNKQRKLMAKKEKESEKKQSKQDRKKEKNATAKASDVAGITSDLGMVTI